MLNPCEDPLGSVRGITILWAFSVVCLAWLVVMGAKRARTNLDRLREIAGEEGFAYTLSFVLTLPIMMLILALVIETTLLLASKAGTFYAAYAAARSAIVWDTAQPAGLGDERVRLAAVHAITPFASTNPASSSGDDGSSQDSTYAYIGAYHAYCPTGPLGDEFLVRRLKYAHAATKVEHQPPPDWGAPITVKVTFEHAFSIGVIGRCLGHVAPWGGSYTYTVDASVTLQNEGAKNDSQSLGIRYDSDY